jgi:hypothetical protein
MECQQVTYCVRRFRPKRGCAGSKVIRGKENIAAHYRESGYTGHLSVVEFEVQVMGA